MPKTPHQTESTRGHILDIVFLVGLVIKGVDGLFEFLVGGALFFITPALVTRFVHHITADELLENPDDLIANFLVHGVAHINKNFLIFGAIYLLIHGAVKLAIFVALIMGAVKVYPWAIGALSILTVYQIYEMFHHFSVGLVLLTIFDIIIIALTIREWREKRTVKETYTETRRWLASLRHKTAH
jgi:uncharacterized membrane protein